MVAVSQILKLAGEIVKEFAPQKIILFGSYAYGTPTADSDVDLMVVMNYRGRELAKAVQILMHTNPAFPIDLLVRRPGELRRAYAEFDPLVREAFDKGKLLYEQDGKGVAGKGRGGLRQRRVAVSPS
jgi:predicted nucleotidyltransferase